MNRMDEEIAFEIVSATLDRWPDLESLFGTRGACGGCWCMYWRLRHKEYEQQKGAGNRGSLHALVAAEQIPGILAYRPGDNDPVGWCSVAPRSEYVRLSTSRLFQPIDDSPVWSVVCLFVRPDQRRQGVSIQLLRGAVDFASGRGAEIVEGYPVHPKKDAMPPVFAFTGTFSAFRAAGFTEVARPSESRSLMRWTSSDK